MDGIVEQVKLLALTADDATYRKLIDTLRLLCVAIERPEDTAHRITFSSFQCCAAKVAIDFKIVDYLVEDNGKPKNVSDLAVKTGLQPLLLGRLLRYMATVGMVHEVSWDTFEASNVTKALAMSGIQGGIGFGYDIVNISAQGLVEYLEKNLHSDIDDIANCPWQFGAKSNETVFQYLFSHPKSLQSFNLWMTHQRLGNKSFLDVYPLSDQFTNMKDSDNNHNDPWVLFVDIGGGVGHVCDVVRQRCPELAHGRVIVQDLPATIAQASTKSDVEAMVHDYFTPQPVKGAKFYYLRNIMHNLADKDCLRILEQTRPALAKDSVILIDDLVVPAKGAHWRATELDMLMMCALGAIERTEKQWNDLLDKAGFKILGSYCYDEVQQDTVLAVVPVDR